MPNVAGSRVVNSVLVKGPISRPNVIHMRGLSRLFHYKERTGNRRGVRFVSSHRRSVLVVEYGREVARQGTLSVVTKGTRRLTNFGHLGLGFEELLNGVTGNKGRQGRVVDHGANSAFVAILICVWVSRGAFISRVNVLARLAYARRVVSFLRKSRLYIFYRFTRGDFVASRNFQGING